MNLDASVGAADTSCEGVAFGKFLVSWKHWVKF